MRLLLALLLLLAGSAASAETTKYNDLTYITMNWDIPIPPGEFCQWLPWWRYPPHGGLVLNNGIGNWSAEFEKKLRTPHYAGERDWSTEQEVTIDLTDPDVFYMKYNNRTGQGEWIPTDSWKKF